MNKRTVRAFSIGILLAVILLGFRNMDDKGTLGVTDAKNIIEEEGYIVMTKKEYQSLVDQTAKKESNQPSTEDTGKEETADTESKEKTDNQQDDSVKEETEVVHFTLEIESGMNSEQISAILEKEKVIDNRKNFETYLKDHDYSTNVQVGSFELNSKMTYEEISEIITKR